MLWGSVRLLLALCLVVGTERSFVDTASLPNPEHDPYQGNVHRNLWNLNPQSNPSSTDSDLGLQGMMSPDQIVNQLKNLKPGASPLDLAYQNSRSEVFSNVNGQKESSVDTKEEVSSNGKKLQSVHVVGHSKDVPESATPSTHIHAEVEIPERGVHRTFDINSPQQNKRKGFTPASRNEADENTVDTGYRSYSGVQYSPLDMAEYVFWTGDEKGVTLAIEEFLQDGLMTREEAISFLQDIKVNLDYLQTHYNEERFQKQQQAKERANQLQKVLNLDKMTESKMAGPSELSEVRQQMRDNLYKKSMETEEPTMNHGRTPSSTHPGSLGLSDDDYEDLLERLRVADFLYTEYSLEEVIYQLAKVMFSQSLTRGSSEAQEALQKFTGFLEVEAEQGRISRSLEKKVLDVLIASLTDTLSEHPELVSAARAGLGNGDLLATGRARNDPALQQLLLLNQDKSAADANKYSVKNHRFQSEGQTNAAGATADAGTAMKKSLPAASKPQSTP